MSEPEKSEPEISDARRHRIENMILGGVFLLICVGGAWLLLTMADVRKAQDCVAQGRRNCGDVIRTDRYGQ